MRGRLENQRYRIQGFGFFSYNLLWIDNIFCWKLGTIRRLFYKIRLNKFKLAEMPTTLTRTTQTFLRVMVLEINLLQCCLNQRLFPRIICLHFERLSGIDLA